MNPKITEVEFYLDVTDRINRGDNLDKWVDDDNGTLLHFAAVSGFAGTVSLLLESGASVDPLTFDNDTPLNMAAHFGHTDTVEILLKNGANVNFLSSDGITPLLDACMSGNIETVKAILNYGPEINEVNDKGQNALTVALIHNHDEVSNYLLQTDIDLNTFDLIRNTPLSYAALFGSSSCVEKLCKNGADVMTLSMSGNTPLHNAVESGNIETIQILLSYGANLSTKNILGETPLAKAFFLYNEQVVDYLCSSLSQGTLKNLAVNDPCPCASGKKYKKCCLNANAEDILMKFSSVQLPKYDSIDSLLEDQIKKADWTYKSKKENTFLGLTPNYIHWYPWQSGIYVTSEKEVGIFLIDVELQEPSCLKDSDTAKEVVLLLTKIKLQKPHNFEIFVTELVDLLNIFHLLTKTHIKYNKGTLSFINITSVNSMLETDVTLQFLIAKNTAYLIRTLKAFNLLIMTGNLLISDWITLFDEFRPDVKTSRLFKEKIKTTFGRS